MKKSVQEYLENKNRTKDNALYIGSANEIAESKRQDAYDKLNRGERIHLYQVQLLNTPKKPESVFNPKTTPKGEVYGYTVNIDAYLDFLKETLNATLDINSNVENRVYKDTSFYRECLSLYRALTVGTAYQEPDRQVYGTHINTFAGYNRAPIALAKEEPRYAEYVAVLSNILSKAIDPVVKPVINIQRDEAEYNNDVMDAFRLN